MSGFYQEQAIIAADHILTALCKMDAYDNPHFRNELLRKVRAWKTVFTPLQYAALWGVVAAFTGVNPEAEKASNIWTKEFTDETEEPRARAELHDKPNLDGSPGL